VTLTVAGSDPSGGAGIQADLKTFHQFRTYGTAVLTLLTVQNTTGVLCSEPVRPSLVRAQLMALLADLPPDAVKIGALGSSGAVTSLAEVLEATRCPVVLDPVLASSSGTPLLSERARRLLVRRLLPRASLVTPNLAEASALLGCRVESLIEMERAAVAIAGLGAHAVLVKGGHRDGEPIDVLWEEGRISHLKGRRVQTTSTHGTGCTLSAGIAAMLAHRATLRLAVETAKRFVTEALESAPGLGSGHGPLNHFAPIRRHRVVGSLRPASLEAGRTIPAPKRERAGESKGRSR
jgi:hydroxymethylpyrimidine/phosphomethylpyrimidine kinase